ALRPPGSRSTRRVITTSSSTPTCPTWTNRFPPTTTTAISAAGRPRSPSTCRPEHTRCNCWSAITCTSLTTRRWHRRRSPSPSSSPKPANPAGCAEAQGTRAQSVEATGSGSVQWPDSGDVLLDRFRGVPQIDRTLCGKPELRAVAKQAPKPKRHRRHHRPPLPKQVVDRLTRNAYRLGQAGNRQPIFRQEVFAKHLSRMRGPPLRSTRVTNAHVQRGSMAVADLSVLLTRRV